MLFPEDSRNAKISFPRGDFAIALKAGRTTKVVIGQPRTIATAKKHQNVFCNTTFSEYVYDLSYGSVDFLNYVAIKTCFAVSFKHWLTEDRHVGDGVTKKQEMMLS